MKCVQSLILGLVTLMATCLTARGQSAADRPPLPSDPEHWLNSSPLAYDGLKGKAAVLWYFEETCPSCAGKWPELLQLAEKYADQPVVFIGVNSGNDPGPVQGYLTKHRIDWPVIVDPARAFEQASGVNQISLQNIHQVRVVTPEGKFAAGRWHDLESTVEWALQGAAWKVKYDRLPEELHPAVRRLEFGDYRPAALAVRDGLKSDSTEIRRAAQQLEQHVEKLIRQALADGSVNLSADDAWSHYELHERVAQQFAPFKLPDAEAEEFDRLRKDQGVQNELRAAKAVSANEAHLSTPDERARLRAVGRLRRVLQTYPETRAAARVKDLLEANGATDAAG